MGTLGGHFSGLGFSYGSKEANKWRQATTSTSSSSSSANLTPNQALWERYKGAINAFVNQGVFQSPESVARKIIDFNYTGKSMDGEIVRMLDGGFRKAMDAWVRDDYILIPKNKKDALLVKDSCPANFSQWENWGKYYCAFPKREIAGAYLARTWDLLSDAFRQDPNTAKGFTHVGYWAWEAETLVNFGVANTSGQIRKDDPNSGTGTGTGTGTDTGTGTVPQTTASAGVPAWVWITIGSVVVLGGGAFFLLKDDK